MVHGTSAKNGRSLKYKVFIAQNLSKYYESFLFTRKNPCTGNIHTMKHATARLKEERMMAIFFQRRQVRMIILNLA